MLRLLQATCNTWNGLLAAARSERAFQQELILLVVAVPLAFVVASGAWLRVALIGVVLLVLIVELLNTALEKLADEVTRELNPGIGQVKDIASAAAGLTQLLAALVWVVALCERFGWL